MQSRLAKEHPTLFFGRLAPSYHPPGRHTAYSRRGPFVFRLRLVAGERIVAVAGEHSGEFGTVLGLKLDGKAPPSLQQ